LSHHLPKVILWRKIPVEKELFHVVFSGQLHPNFKKDKVILSIIEKF
jgi:hypothetical protein